MLVCREEHEGQSMAMQNAGENADTYTYSFFFFFFEGGREFDSIIQRARLGTVLPVCAGASVYVCALTIGRSQMQWYNSLIDVKLSQLVYSTVQLSLDLT